MAAHSSNDIVPELYKPLAKYLQQAKKISKVDPVVAYACRMFVLQEAMSVKSKEKECKDWVMHLLLQLENEKKSLPKLEKEDLQQHVENFALNVFSHADNEDRSGNASKQTVMSFVTAYLLMEVVEQFGELASDLQEKMKYAKWKAADISKALKEGRQPTPGAFDEKVDDNNNLVNGSSHLNDNGQNNDNNNNNHHNQFEPLTHDVSPSSVSIDPPPLPANLGLPPPPTSTPAVRPPAAAAAANTVRPVVPTSRPVSSSSSSSTPKIPAGQALVIEAHYAGDKTAAIIQGEKLAAHAVSSLRFRDVNTAIMKMKEAIALLLPHTES